MMYIIYILQLGHAISEAIDDTTLAKMIYPLHMFHLPLQNVVQLVFILSV